MSWISRDDMTRHREWLDGQVSKKERTVVFENVSPTYVIRVSRDWVPNGPRLGDIIESAISQSDYRLGGDILTGVGIWEGKSDDSATVIVQATDAEFQRILAILAGVQGIRWAHVEKHEVPTSYVDLDLFR